MYHGTCVTRVPWCMSGSLTRGGGENVPGIPGACAPAILRIWQEAHGKSNAVTFWYTADSIINEFYRQPHTEDSNVDKIKNCPDSCKFAIKWYKMYRTTTGCTARCLLNIIPKWTPWVFTRNPIVHILLQYLFVGKNTEKNRTLVVPLQLGLALQMHHREFNLIYFL